MISVGRKEITRIETGDKRSISKVYMYGKLVWEAIRSCFGSGFWINKEPWDNKNSWINK